MALIVALAAIAVVGAAFVTAPKPIPLVAFAGAPASRPGEARGEALAKLGDCAVCHTPPGGADFAGGRPIETPFGAVYSTNITPGRSGLAGWSYEAFARSMRDGVSRDGHYLYPAFPYDHFRQLEEADLRDLYDFVMTRAPVEAPAPTNRLVWPLEFRPLIEGWRLLFLHGAPIPADPAQSPEWNRGRYFVDGLAHCGACHTPRNLLGAEASQLSFDGGWADGWYAPALNQKSPAPKAWTADDLTAYLTTGFSARHAAAAGPMGEVVRSLATAPASDIRAIAVYVASQMPQSETPQPQMRNVPAPNALFRGACGNCHGDGAPMTQMGRPSLAAGTPLYEPTPRDAMAIVLKGLKTPTGRSGPAMPAYADVFNDAEVASLVGYLRARFTPETAWSQDLTAEAHAARSEARP